MMGQALSVLSMLLMAAPAAAGEIQAETARGAVSVPYRPAVVAALDVPAIDTLAALGVPLAAVPGRLYVSYLSRVARDATPAGTLFEPDLEALNALGPDLIIAGGRSSAEVDSLARLAPTIDMTIWGADQIGQTRARLRAYGAIFGLEARAAALDAALLAALQATQAAASGAGAALVILTNGPKLSAFGPGSRFGWLHDAVGLPAASPDLEALTHGQAISFGFIAETDPERLIVVDRGAAIGQGGAGAAATLDNELVAGGKAARNHRIIILDAADLYIAGGGYTATMRTLDALRRAFEARR
ncbi:MAG: siderophore ABC transporter substrate-binding protein [Pikeienuella sp.]|uniref:siderophore ABC transporter substrate-binding protein n=1 Tax=Pikeienuella sp. TaxID=2831957 RepID=UPI00391CD714